MFCFCAVAQTHEFPERQRPLRRGIVLLRPPGSLGRGAVPQRQPEATRARGVGHRAAGSLVRVDEHRLRRAAEFGGLDRRVQRIENVLDATPGGGAPLLRRAAQTSQRPPGIRKGMDTGHGGVRLPVRGRTQGTVVGKGMDTGHGGVYAQSL